MMSTAENPHAGQGSSVLLDIGDDVGALVVTLPAELEGAEIELVPTRGGHQPNHHHWPHVAVVPRRAPDGAVIHSAVFYEVPCGDHGLRLRPDGPIRLTARVTGGEVTHCAWPR